MKSSIEETSLEDIVNVDLHPFQNLEFQQQCKGTLNEKGVLVLEKFLKFPVIEAVKQEGKKNQHLAFFTDSNHNIYLKPTAPGFPAIHPRNREVISSKGCITTDQIPMESALRTLYDADGFRQFLCRVLGESSLYEYADPPLIHQSSLCECGAGAGLAF